MRAHTFTVLEFDSLLTLLASYARSEPGGAAVRSFAPLLDPSAAKREQQRYADPMAVLTDEGILPGITVENIRPLLKRLEPAGAILNGDELIPCRQLLDTVKSLYAAREQEQFEGRDTLDAEIDSLDPCKALRDDLHRSIAGDGGIQDEASEELAAMRRRIRHLESDIQDRLNHMLRRRDMAQVVQEQFVTLRNNRFVIPIKREMKSRCRGIVHDHSDTGRTLFIEPSQTLPLGNELVDLRLDERDECIRILTRLCNRIRARMPAFLSNFDTLVHLDASFAVARWAVDYQAHLPRFGNRLDLHEARHPLLEHQFRSRQSGETVVPLDLDLPDSVSILGITGANSGGKTVAMKTLGLLGMAACAGLPVTAAPESRLEFFSLFYADIGDEQSLTENLSTFTGHMGRIRDVLEALETADGAHATRALILFDELGAGTDPLEGGALACAVLDELVDRAALTVLTTHLGVIKNKVHEHERMLNAAVRFNAETLEPEYTLDVGLPGASNAFRIARRIGLPDRVVKRAESLLGTDHLKLENLLETLETDQRRLAEEADRARAAREAAETLRHQLGEERDTLRRERKQTMREAYEQAQATVNNTRKEMEQIIRELREHDKNDDTLQAAREARETLEQKERKLDTGQHQNRLPAPKPLDPQTMAEGNRVYVPKLGGDATITSLRPDRKRATVQTGLVTCSVAVSDLAPPRGGQPPKEKSEPHVHVATPKAKNRQVSTELKLIGMRTDEATPKLHAFLDQAALANLNEVRIIHGMGTGRLRAAVQDTLRQHPNVENFRLGEDGKDPGGTGATWVTLA